jgi:8-amino-7-oxononanoate synthase
MAFAFIQAALAERERSALLRKRVVIDSNHQSVIEVGGEHFINFSSNDYLGLSQHPDVLQSFAEGLSLYGASSSASSVVTGYSIEHKRLEEDICKHTNMQSALLFSSGFAANQAICKTLFGPTNKARHRSHILADKFMHASFVDGALGMSNSVQFARFKHNDLVHFAQLLNKVPKDEDALVVTEGIFSMDGDTCDLLGIQKEIKARADTTWLMLDDAHAIGVIGAQGMGTCDASEADAQKANIVMGTFGKALGTQGAFIASNSPLIEYLVNFSKEYIYSTAMPAAQARATLTSFQIMRKGVEREKLLQNIALFQSLAKQAELPLMDACGPIQGLIIGSPEKALRLSEKLRTLGIWVMAIRSPTVPKNTDRLRITLNAMHQERDIRALIDALVLAMSSMDK